MSSIFSRRRVGVLVLTGAAAGLITLAAAPGSASASPDIPYVPNVPGVRSVNLDSVALNPQPLPPGPDWSRVALNPQPLPPGPPPPDLSLVALNPQPLPPGPPDLSLVALNPQPLPPAPDWSRLVLPRLGF